MYFFGKGTLRLNSFLSVFEILSTLKIYLLFVRARNNFSSILRPKLCSETGNKNNPMMEINNSSTPPRSPIRSVIS